VRLEEVGEFGIIDRLEGMLRSGSDRIVCGIGDDAALIRQKPGFHSVLTTDALVEGVHFDLTYTPLDSLGWKSLAVSLSDLAAMGATPVCAVVSVAVPGSFDLEGVEAFFSGLKRCGEAYQCPVAGGDTVRSLRDFFISVAVEGEVESGKAVLRSGAKPGDALCVTGELGGAKTGFEVLSGRGEEDLFPESVRRFLEPFPRIREASELLRRLPVSSMIDVSDGLASEIGHLCRRSRTGCRIRREHIPLSREAARWAERKQKSIDPFLYESGEDYELLFTVDSGAFADPEGFRRTAQELQVTILGEITESEKGISVENNGKLARLATKGWDHFA
jgi:thiamine-monophosphate kinase